ncbi:MAG: ABC transporter substrate-binding protein [Bacillota bacterium]
MTGKKTMKGKAANCPAGKSRWTGILLPVLFAVVLLTAVSCSPATAPADDQGPINVRLAIARDEGSLNPYTYVSGYPGHNLLLLIYDTLFQLDEQNVPQPWLVKSYQSDADGLVWSFTLHEGVTWHDGAPLTAEDVKFSYEFYREHNHGRWTKAVAAVESIEVQDELNFTVKLSAPVPAFLMNPLADVPIIPGHIWQDVTDPDNFTDNTGSGPYRVVSHEPDRTYKLEANTEYFLGKPAVDEIGIVIIEDQTATFTALRVGDIDIAARSLLPELVEEFSGSPDVKVLAGPGFVSTLLQINNEREPFDDPRVRLAIARAIDLDDLVETVLLGYGTAGNPGYIHPALPGYKTGLQHITDLAQARTLLEEAGFAGSYGNKEFELLIRSNDPLRVRTAEIIAESLAAIGMNVKVKALDSSTVDSLVWPDFDVTQGRDYDLAIWGWSAPVMLDPARLGALLHSDLTTWGTLNIGAYAGESVDAVVEELAVTVDPDRQAALLSDLQEMVAETVPFVTLFYPDGIYAYRPETYDGWLFQNGQGILNKLSFVPIP